MSPAPLVGLAVLAATTTAFAHGHERCRGGLVGYGPVNPYKWTMTADLYTTNLAPTFRELRGGGVGRAPVNSPVNSTDRQERAAPRTGSIPSIVLPAPPSIPNPQLTPPPIGGSTTNALPPPPTPASVKPSSAAGQGGGSTSPQSISPRRP